MSFQSVRPELVDVILEGDTLAEVISFLYDTHATAMRCAEAEEAEETGPLLEVEAAVLTHILQRVCPVALQDALALWEEHAVAA